MRTPLTLLSSPEKRQSRLPSSLDTATYAVTLLEDNALFNSGHGAVFTRDGINELEASVMVSHGCAKRGVGVSGLRRVRNPILLAKVMLERGDEDLSTGLPGLNAEAGADGGLNVPSAQGHTLVFGETAEKLAKKYGLEMVDPSYFFTQKRWDQHVTGLEREKHSRQASSASWSPEEYIPQGTCGAVALDEDGVLCVATSTGGITNKLSGRIGDTPVVGAGIWAEEWEVDPSAPDQSGWSRLRRQMQSLKGPAVTVANNLRGLLADCLPSPFVYQPIVDSHRQRKDLQTMMSVAVSGTGNGDSFMRLDACRTVGAIARFGRIPTWRAIASVAGQRGELQMSAGARWGRTGEGEGGMIGIQCIVSRDGHGNVIGSESEIIQAHNCGGLFRAWIDEEGHEIVKIFEPDEPTRHRSG
jgi:L-asparaginase